MVIKTINSPCQSILNFDKSQKRTREAVVDRHLVDSCWGGCGSFDAANNQQNDCCYSSAGHDQVTITLK